MTKKSNISNSQFILRTQDSCLGYGSADNAMFSPGGDMCVMMNGYLVAPLECFTPRQIKGIAKRAKAAASAKQIDHLIGGGA